MLKNCRYLFVYLFFYFAAFIDIEAQNYFYEESSTASEKVFVASGLFSAECDSMLLDKLCQRGSEATNACLVVFGGEINERLISDSVFLSRIELAKNSFGRIIVLPNLADWLGNKKNGYLNVLGKERNIDSVFGNEQVFLPENGCPGSIEIELSNDLILILFDPVSWLNPWNRDEEQEFFQQNCGMEDNAEFYLKLDDAIKRNEGKTILIASFYPLFSEGKHGGKFPLKSHFLPLPGLGTSYVLYRKLFGQLDDLSNYQYKSFKEIVLDIIEKRNLIYISGLENNFQYQKKDGLHFVNAASMNKSEYVKRNTIEGFAHEAIGFVELEKFGERQVKLSYWSKETEPVFKQDISLAGKEAVVDGNNKTNDCLDSLKTAVSKSYDACGFKQFWMGRNYRDAWSMETVFPSIDISNECGGLEIIKRGGGQQTRSIRLQAKDGRQLVLRSVDKFTERALPDELKKTFAAAVVQDQISASFPYAAPIVANFADIVGVYHTNPKLVYLPPNENLGIYNEELAGSIYLYEERPDDEWNSSKGFGCPDKIQGTPKVLSKILRNHNNSVDQMAVLKARLFDVWVNDWDRHDDQWRWAAFKNTEGWVYRPIPRDRDQAFFVNEGVVPWLASRKWALRKIQGFDKNTKDIPGLVYNARYFDRTFLNEPQLSDWLAIADTMQVMLSDTVIDEVLKQMPEAIYELYGSELSQKLKARRDNLVDFANRFYSFVSKEVDVVGSEKNEEFIVRQVGCDSIDVMVLKSDNPEKEIIYHRTFAAKETNEVVLYGLGGDDVFRINEISNNGIRFRIVGGEGKDTLINNCKKRLKGKSIIFYDQKNAAVAINASDVKLKLKNNSGINNYNRKAYKYDVLHPIVNAGYNKDDGFSYGIGVGFKKHGFRKEPYAYYQKLKAEISTKTLAYQFKYSGDFTSIFRNVNLLLDANGDFPQYSQNFFGLGNETKIASSELNYYKVRWESISFGASLSTKLFEKVDASIGSFVEAIDIEEREENSFLAAHPEYINDPKIFQDFHYTGVKLGVELNTRDDEHLPKHGMLFKNEYKFVNAFDGYHGTFHHISSELSFFKSFKNSDRAVLAFRFGGMMNLGEYKFFHYNVLGGKTNLRGYRNQRFYGEKLAYQNSELRLRIFNFSNYIFKGKAGVLLFNDLGRVWVSNENSDILHHGYGMGFWLAPYEKIVMNANWGHSVENELFTFNLSYFF